MRPELDPDFAAKLDAWAAAWLPARGRAPRAAQLAEKPRSALDPALRRRLRDAADRPRRRPSRSSAVPAASDNDHRARAPEAERPRRAPEGRSGRRGGSAIAPAPTTVAPPSQRPRPRRRQKRARPSARSRADRSRPSPTRCDDVADGVIEVTERYDGIVLALDVHTRRRGARAPSISRIPAQHLQARSPTSPTWRRQRRATRPRSTSPRRVRRRARALRRRQAEVTPCPSSREAIALTRPSSAQLVARSELAPT